MNQADIYDKTEKGREEIATRKYHLAPRMRSLLVLIDGKHELHDLLAKVAGLNLTEAHLTELLNGEYIYLSHATPLPQEETPPPPPPNFTPERFLSLHQFYTDAIRDHIGLRGYALQLRVEKAASLEDFANLRNPFLEAIIKTTDQKKVRALRDELDALLAGTHVTDANQ